MGTDKKKIEKEKKEKSLLFNNKIKMVQILWKKKNKFWKETEVFLAYYLQVLVVLSLIERDLKGLKKNHEKIDFYFVLIIIL